MASPGKNTHSHGPDLKYSFYENCTSYSEPIASLEHLVGSEVKFIHIYPNEEVTFGRDESCTHVIDDWQVSKRHLQIYSVIYEKDKPDVQPLVYCEDLQSTNGTYINNNLIGQINHDRVGYLLSHGDIIEIPPSWKFTFTQPNYQVSQAEESQGVEVKEFRDQFTLSTRILGSGQYGKVFLAKEVTTSKQVACKVIDLDDAAKHLEHAESLLHTRRSWHTRNAQGRQKVKREVEILTRLSHPHIINIRKAFYFERTLFIFTDLAPAGDLFSYVESQGGSLVDWNCRILAWQVLLAIQYLHEKSIVHRDIKPENILITQTGFGGRVVLTDFGFANYSSKLTGRLMSKLGTAGFVAPEVDFRDKLAPDGYTAAADMWSYGVLTAFLFTGTMGVPCDAASQLSQEQIVDRFCSTSDCPNQIGRRPVDFLRQLLVLDPDQRITAEEALEHPWFKKPSSEALELQKGYKRIIRFWKERNQDEEVIVQFRPSSLSSHYVPTNPSDHSTSRLPKRLPDVSASPYFGLDRHLRNRIPSSKKELIDSLNGTGIRFVKSLNSRTRIQTSSLGDPLEYPPAKSVHSSDIFRRSMVDVANAESQDETQDDLDVVGTICQTIVPRGRASVTKGLGITKSEQPLQLDVADSHKGMQELHRRKRGRTDSEDGRIQDAVVKQLPRYTTAKALKDMKDKFTNRP